MASTNLISHPAYQEAIKCMRQSAMNIHLMWDMTKKFIKEDKPERIVTLMERYLHRAGIEKGDLDKLHFIHVAGSKGKGSTTIFTENLLRHHGYKTGTIVSPNFHELRERICINGRPISKDLFCHYFWDVFKKLENSTVEGAPEEGGCMPGQFDFLLVMGMRVFISERVDVVVLEVGKGGRFDKTNFIRQPVVCGITPLAMEHVESLGPTLERIAWHKAGIIKPGRPVITQPQKPEALQVILDTARENKSPVHTVSPLLSDYQNQYKFRLGLAGDVQLQNAGLALQLFRTFKAWKEGKPTGLQTYGQIPLNIADIPVLECGDLSASEVKGLANSRSFGRTQHVHRGKVSYFIDFAATEDSMKNFVRWFKKEAGAEAATINGKVARVLVFNCVHEKDHKMLFSMLKDLDFHGACFPFLRICEKEPLSEFSDERHRPVFYDYDKEHLDLVKADWDMIIGKDTAVQENSKGNSQGNKCENDQGNSREHSHLNSQEKSVENGGKCQSREKQNSTESQSKRNEEITEITEPSQSQAFECALHAIVWASQGKDPEVAACMATPQEELPPAPAAMREADHIQVVVVSSSKLVGIALALTVPNLLD